MEMQSIDKELYAMKCEDREKKMEKQQRCVLF